MNEIKHNLREQLNASGYKIAELERVSHVSRPTIMRMFNEDDASSPDLINLVAVVKVIGGSLDRICGLVSDDNSADPSVQIADAAISAYAEILQTKDIQLAEKDRIIADKDKQIARYEHIIDTLMQYFDNRDDSNG